MTMIDAEKENAHFEKHELSGSLPGIITTTSEGNLGGKGEDKKSESSE